MSQITIYTPDAIAAQAKLAASQAHLSLSSWITQIITHFTQPAKQDAHQGWSDDFWVMAGSWKNLDFPTAEEIRSTQVPDLPRV